MIRIFNDNPNQVISFSRTKGYDKVVLIMNYSDQTTKVTLHSKYQKGSYADYFSNQKSDLGEETVMDLAPWSYKILVSKKE